MAERKSGDTWPLSIEPAQIPELPYPNQAADPQAIWCRPLVDPTAWVAPGAVVLGRVELRARSSVWYGCILRGDGEWIEVGEETNVQDGAILHVDPGYPCLLGSRVTLGHGAIVHASTVEDEVLIGIGATVLSGCVIGAGALIAAGAVVREGTKVPPHTLWAGCPARKMKELDADQRDRLAHTHRHYVNNAALYLARFGREHIDALTQG
jgi:gamma-carbonic anhydrase